MRRPLSPRVGVRGFLPLSPFPFALSSLARLNSVGENSEERDAKRPMRWGYLLRPLAREMRKKEDKTRVASKEKETTLRRKTTVRVSGYVDPAS